MLYEWQDCLVVSFHCWQLPTDILNRECSVNTVYVLSPNLAISSSDFFRGQSEIRLLSPFLIKE